MKDIWCTLDINIGVDVLILNRNRKLLTDKLCLHLESLELVNSVNVIDSGSRDEEKSEWTVIGDDSVEVRSKGLRPNRGFNLGIDWWLKRENKADWVLLCPNDTIFTSWNLDFFQKWTANQKISAIVPLSNSSPYTAMLGKRPFGLVWHINEGPIFISKTFIELIVELQNNLFDSTNFRGYMSFLDLAFRSYAGNKGILVTTSVLYEEDVSIIKEQYNIIGTEEQQKNFELMIIEGEKWLSEKYGVQDAG